MPLVSASSLRSIIFRSVVIGIAAGMRSMTPFGVLAKERDNTSVSGSWQKWPVLRSRAGRIVLQMAWWSELMGDKMPVVPARITPEPLGGRAMTGALAGMAIGTAGSGATPKIVGAVFGAAGAVAGSYGGYHARSYLTKEVGLPDLPGALVEDVTAWVVAKKAIRA